MGLDTSHDCWHGPYSAFMRWRCFLNHAIRGKGTHREDLEQAWADGFYNDPSKPLYVLMNHSDCDGTIPAEICGPMADALQTLMDEKMPARAMYDEARPATERFIAGLRRAAAANEDVRFH
jgi:hypothetical protein